MTIVDGDVIDITNIIGNYLHSTVGQPKVTLVEVIDWWTLIQTKTNRLQEFLSPERALATVTADYDCMYWLVW
jgi:molybdopterin/thiamine biosynthesis adenylyltransferase